MGKPPNKGKPPVSTSFVYTLVISGGAESTLATFIPVEHPLPAPVASGTVVGMVEVEPSNWSGIITVEMPFSMQGNNVVVAEGQELTEGSYTIAGEATP